MLKIRIVDVDEIYCGDEAFEDGEITTINELVDNGEGGYAEIWSEKLNRNYRVYSGEFDAFEILKIEFPLMGE